MKRLILCIAALAAMLSTAAGQTLLSGTVINARTKQPLAAVSVQETESRRGSYTDKNGEFSLSVAGFPVQIRVSHIGYAEQIRVCDSSGVRISLKPIVLHAEEVFVTAQRAIDGKTPIAYSTLEREDIEALYHQQDVPLVLDMEPGVYAYSDAGDGTGYSYLNIRGFSQDRIGIMYNGVPLNDPEAHAVYWVDHGDILNDASDVQVQRGIGNSLSSTAFGGAVNVESDIGKLEPGVSMDIGYGNFIDGNALNAPSGKRSISYVGDPGAGEGLRFAFRLSDLNSAGYRIGSGTEQQSAHLSLQWTQPTHKTRAGYLWGHQKTHFSWDGVSPQYGYDLDDMDERRYNFYADTSYNGGYNDVNRDVFTQSLAFVNHTHILREDLKLYATLYHIDGEGYYQQFKAGEDPVEHNLTQILDNDSSEVDLIRRKWLDNRYTGGVYHLTYLLPRHMLTVGGDLRLYGSGHYGRVVHVEDHGNISENHRFYNNTTWKSSFSFYLRDMMSLGDKCFVQGDLRYLTHRFHVMQDTIGAFTSPYDFILRYRFLDAHLGLRYNVSERLSGFVNISTSKREPSSDDIYDDSDPYVMAAVEDPYGGELTEALIRHESLTDMEAGIDYMRDGLRLSLNLYRMDFRNELIPVYYRYRDTDEVLRGNAPHTLHQGLEFAGEYAAGTFDVQGNLTLADNHFVEFTADSLGWGGFGGIADYAGKRIPAFPAVQVKARIAYRHERVQPWLHLRYVGKQYIDFMNTESAAIPAYFVADAGLRLPFEILDMRHVLDLRVNNVFNALYETFGYVYYNAPDERIDNYWPAATRNFYLSWSLMFGS